MASAPRGPEARSARRPPARGARPALPTRLSAAPGTARSCAIPAQPGGCHSLSRAGSPCRRRGWEALAVPDSRSPSTFIIRRGMGRGTGDLERAVPPPPRSRDGAAPQRDTGPAARGRNPRSPVLTQRGPRRPSPYITLAPPTGPLPGSHWPPHGTTPPRPRLLTALHALSSRAPPIVCCTPKPRPPANARRLTTRSRTLIGRRAGGPAPDGALRSAAVGGHGPSAEERRAWGPGGAGRAR